jgi:hypothetical protein
VAGARTGGSLAHDGTIGGRIEGRHGPRRSLSPIQPADEFGRARRVKRSRDDRGLAVGQAGRITTWQVCVQLRVLHADDDFPLGVTCFQVPDRLRSLVQGVGPVDDRCDLSGFDKFLQHGQVLSAGFGEERAQPLAHER